jgi:hypothetical protein
MKSTWSKFSLIYILAIVSLIAISCGDSTPTALGGVPAVQKYAESFETEYDLLDSANQTNSEAWTKYSDTIEQGFLGLTMKADTTAAGAALASARTKQRRAGNLIDALAAAQPPASCQRYHTLLEEWAEANLGAAIAQIRFIESLSQNGSVSDSIQTQLSSAFSQSSQVIDDLNAASQTCR